MKFVRGLNDGFDNVKSKVLIMSPLPTIITAFNLAIKHERQKNDQVSQSIKPQVMYHVTSNLVSKASPSPVNGVNNNN